MKQHQGNDVASTNAKLLGPARKSKTIMQRQQRDWNDEAQLQFLTYVYNKIRDNFALPHKELTALKKIIGDK